MYVIKGFMPHSRFANNAKGITAAFGEISTLALTYAREKGIYKSSLSAELELFTFTTMQDAKFVTLTTDYVDHITKIVKWVYDSVLAVHGELFVDEMLGNAMSTFATIAENFDIGEMVQDDQGYWAPSWISWKAKNLPGMDADNNIKIWLADTAFREQFDEFEILVVSPLPTTEDFFKVGTEVKRLLGLNTPSSTMYAIQTAKGDNPETIIRAEAYDYHDPYTNQVLTQAPFYVLVYGAAGNNIDSINDAIIDYLLSHSTRTRDEWIKILPDLFKRTEFIIVPMENQFAIPNRELQVGIYSPTTSLKRTFALVKQAVPSYPPAHIDEHLMLTSHPYKSLALAVVGSPDNREALFKMTDVFPDYINVLTSSNDFARMSKATQDWALLLNRMIIEAEKMSKYTTLPIDMSKVTRDGVLYATARFGNINYLVAAKSNFGTVL